MSDTRLDEIAEFSIKNGEGLYSKLNWNAIKEFAKKHIDFKTIIVVRDKDGILAVCRWNMIKEDTAHILDLIIRQNHNYKQLIKRILLKGLKIFPSAKYLVWERQKKYPNRKKRKYLITDILKKEI